MSKTFGTFGSKMFDPLELKGLDRIGDLFNVMEELQIEEESDQWNTLLDSSRELVYSMNAEVKLNNVTSKQKSCKMYFFNDLFIVGQYKKTRRKKNTMTTMGTADDVFFGEMIGRKKSEYDRQDDDASQDDLRLESASNPAPRSVRSRKSGKKSMRKASAVSGHSTSTELPQLKIKLWMELENVDLRKVEVGGEPGIKCSCTVQETVEDETGELQYTTEVQQVQFFLSDEAMRDQAFERLQGSIDGILEAKIRGGRGGSKFGDDFTLADTMTDGGSVRADSVDDFSVDGDTQRADKLKRMVSTLKKKQSESAASTGTAASKKRSYASGKETMRKMRLNRNKKKTGTLHEGQMEGLSLDDLVERYKVVLSPEEQGQTAEFAVSFGPGPMGFALSSVKGSGVGVFVGKLESGGMAELGGVTLGDRMLQVGSQVVDEDMAWTDAIQLIKTKRMELGDDGKPKKLIVKFSRARSVEENVAKKVEEERKKKIKDRIKKRGNKRQWTKRKNKSFGSRMASLSDIKDRYDNKRAENEARQERCDVAFEMLLDGAESKKEKKCAHILKEIFDTERAYLSQIYSLVDNYMGTLKKKKISVLCREISGSKFCEHSVPRNNCKEMSGQLKHLMEKSDLKALFGNAELLLKINESLMKALQAGLENMLTKQEAKGERVSVVDVALVYSPVFSNVMPFFRIYSHYAFQYSNALETLNRLKENPAFKEELTKIEQRKGNETLTSLLMKPIARLCKYPLLFSTLNDAVQAYIEEVASKAMETGAGDIDKLDKCLTSLLGASRIVADIAESVDVKVGTSHDLDKLYEIYEEIGGHKAVQQFMVPSRRFIGKYEVFLEDKNSKKSKLKPQWIYLFNDLVIFAAEKNGFFGGTRAGSFMKLKTRGKGTLDGKSSVGDSKSKVSGSRVSASRSKTKRDKQAVNVKKKVKIDAVNVRKKVVPNKEELHGFSFVETERKVSIVKKSKEETQETNMLRYDIWCTDVEERDEILKKMSEQVKAYKKNKRDKKKINAKLKPELRKRQRQWKSKARKLREKSMQDKPKLEMVEMNVGENNGTVEAVDEE